MNTVQFDKQIDTYYGKLKSLDHYAEMLPDDLKAEYRSARNRYAQRLRAWQRTLGAELAMFDHNVEEGYNELESVLTRTNVH